MRQKNVFLALTLTSTLFLTGCLKSCKQEENGASAPSTSPAGMVVTGGVKPEDKKVPADGSTAPATDESTAAATVIPSSMTTNNFDQELARVNAQNDNSANAYSQNAMTPTSSGASSAYGGTAYSQNAMTPTSSSASSAYGGAGVKSDSYGSASYGSSANNAGSYSSRFASSNQERQKHLEALKAERRALAAQSYADEANFPPQPVSSNGMASSSLGNLSSPLEF